MIPSQDKAARRLGRLAEAFYRETDPILQQSERDLRATCRKGCSACCGLLVFISLPEAVAIAEGVLADPKRFNIPELSRRCVDQIVLFRPRITRAEWFQLRQPCVFLSAAKECTVYQDRPFPCRSHSVITDPVLCSPDVEATVQRFDTTRLDVEILSRMSKASRQFGWPLLMAPLPVAFLWALKLLTEGKAACEEAMKDPELGALSLQHWMEWALTVEQTLVEKETVDGNDAGRADEGQAGDGRGPQAPGGGGGSAPAGSVTGEPKAGG